MNHESTSNKKGKLSILNDIGAWWSIDADVYKGYDIEAYTITSPGRIQNVSCNLSSPLIVKLTKAGCMNNYVNGIGDTREERFVAMLLIGREEVHVLRGGSHIIYLPAIERQIQQYSREFTSMLINEMQTHIAEGKEKACFYRLRNFPYKNALRQISAREFFEWNMNPNADGIGAAVYKRDKAYFLHGQRLDPPKFTLRDLQQMSVFAKSKMTNQELSQIDMYYSVTPGMRDMSFLFSWLSSIEKLDISALRTKGVTNMDNMFCGCERLKRLDLSSFDTATVKDMGYMFQSCKQLEVLDLSGFDFSSVTDMAAMFEGCDNLREVIVSESILGAGKVPHFIRYVKTWGDTGGSAQSNSQADYMGTYGVLEIPEYEKVPFGKATKEEQYKYLRLRAEAKLTIVPQK